VKTWVLFEQKKGHNYEIQDILWKIKQIMQRVLKIKKIFLLPNYIKLISRCLFLLVFAYSTGHLKVKKALDLVMEVSCIILTNFRYSKSLFIH